MTKLATIHPLRTTATDSRRQTTGDNSYMYI